MTRPDRDYDDILSRVLHSTLDPIEPMGDGLAKIQRRIAEPWLKRQVSLLRTETSALGWLILVRCEPFLNWARSGLTAMAAASARWFRPGRPGRSVAAARASSRSGRHGSPRGRGRSADGPAWLGPTVTWLRPALAVAGAVVLVVAGAFALQKAGVVFSPVNSSSTTTNNNNAPGGGTGNGGVSSPMRTHGSSGPGPEATHKQAAKSATGVNPASSASCSPTPAPTTTSPSPTPTTPTPTATATPTQTATPTPTATVSPTAPAGGSIGSGNGGEPNDVGAVSLRAAGSVHGHVVLGSCGPSPSSSSGGPTTFGSG